MPTSSSRLPLAAICAFAALALIPASASASSQSECIGHHPQPYVWYTHSCTGHDEPELDPLSSLPGSAQDLTWTFVLPSNGPVVPVDAVGPTFWIGGVVSDPNSLFGQAFLELQFYPNSLVKGCAAGGGFNVVVDPGIYTVCSPVWEVSKHGNSESAAFNAMLTNSKTGGPLIMHAGDTITDHQYITAAADGMHITVTDLTRGTSGTIVLASKVDGPLMPAFSTQEINNALGWGVVNDAPNAFVWEIGHTGNYTSPAGKLCDPGSATKPICYSYDVPTWLKFSPIQIKSVTFGPGKSPPTGWAAVSDFGGVAEVDAACGAGNFGQPFCTYPWYSYNRSQNAFNFGGDYAVNSADFGQAAQFATTEDCVSPSDGSPQYCATPITPPTPPGP
jgi:hypothetical protein